MGTNLKDVYYCQMNRNTELSNRMSNRNIPSHQIGSAYFARPVDTYATVFPMLDCHKPATVTKAAFPIYNQERIFNPGQSAPYNGFASNVDVESRLHNSFAPLQKCAQGKYIPSSNSDMFNSNYLVKGRNEVMSHNLLFREQSFNPFNPNNCNLGHKLFNNHIRQQIKNVELTDGSVNAKKQSK